MLFVNKLLKEKRINENVDYSFEGNMLDLLNKPRSKVPAVTHVDYTARVQTVSHDDNPFINLLLHEFYKLTNIPFLVNTSFNVRGEPIVCNVKDAFECFMGTNLDMLVCGDFILYKNEQNQSLKEDHKSKFSKD